MNGYEFVFGVLLLLTADNMYTNYINYKKAKRVVRAAPKPKKHTKVKRASPKQGSAGISKEGEV